MLGKARVGDTIQYGDMIIKVSSTTSGIEGTVTGSLTKDNVTRCLLKFYSDNYTILKRKKKRKVKKT